MSTQTTRPMSDSLPEHVVLPVSRIEGFLASYVDGLDTPPNLRDAIGYALLGPGKRLRPLLVWHCAVAGGADPERALPAAGAVELVHAFSLVHDDLPGMDDDDLRRGRPTLHKHTNDAMAILAGDAMLNLAFSLLTSSFERPLSASLVGELADATGRMIAGQVYDTLGGLPESMPDEERIEQIHMNKTGALIRASCRLGALLGPDAAALDPITTYAEHIGLMFQIVDDILDVTQATDHLGKRAGKDADAGKLTYPGVLGLERSMEEVRRHHEAATGAIEPLGAGAAPLIELADFMAVRTR